LQPPENHEVPAFHGLAASHRMNARIRSTVLPMLAAAWNPARSGQAASGTCWLDSRPRKRDCGGWKIG